MKIPTCADCGRLNRSGICPVFDFMMPHDNPLCPYFINKDGKRPRFCRAASDVSEMAALLVWEGFIKGDPHPRWMFDGDGQCHWSRDRAIEAAKEWLLEMEDGE